LYSEKSTLAFQPSLKLIFKQPLKLRKRPAAHKGAGSPPARVRGTLKTEFGFGATLPVPRSKDRKKGSAMKKKGHLQGRDKTHV
jgi:hypothetical protein